MFKLTFLFASLIGIFVLGTTASAFSDKTFSLPSHVKEISPGVYDLGQAKVQGRLAQGLAFVHYKEKSAKPSSKPGGGKASGCYGFLSKDMRWKTTEGYVLDSTNRSGMSEELVSSTFATSLNTWDTQVPFQIFGNRDTSQVADGADTSSPDNKNEVYFAQIQDSNAIAVTIVWGYYSGPTFTREILEYDMIFDDVKFNWGDATLDSTVMDFENIATHELGHAAGLDDLYTAACAQETMYGYGTEGETQKRDLNPGDIEGIRKLYRI